MIAVIFELTPAELRFADYKRLAEELAADLKDRDGFISIERLENISRPGQFRSYRLRVAQVVRDHTMHVRGRAPDDSVQVYG